MFKTESEINLNLGCGESYLEGFVNVDCVSGGEVKPDLVLDISHDRFPYEDGAVDNIFMIHSIEHIEMFHWKHIFNEIVRCLKPNGKLVLSYPEFKECADRFIRNVGNQKSFWRATLYGRQLYKSDYHVVPMDSMDLKQNLEALGFYRVHFGPESDSAPYNTTLVASKDPAPISREDVLNKELNLKG